jgi:3-phenylpropionate/cinnamic acid dioxygenase small subunit
VSLTRSDAEAFLYREARLLDERRYDEWLALFTDDALYWVPAEDAPDPYAKVSLIHDDGLRRAERVFRVTRTNAHSQDPASRIQHFVSNVEVENGGAEAVVYSSQIVYEIRAGGGNYRHYELGEQRALAARCEHRLRQDAGGQWRIARKKMLLLNRDMPIGNLTFIF